MEGVLTPEKRDELIEGLASRLKKWRMVAPAILFLEAHKPLAFPLSQFLLLAQPALEPLLGADVGGYALLFEDGESLDLILSRLEEVEEG